MGRVCTVGGGCYAICAGGRATCGGGGGGHATCMLEVVEVVFHVVEVVNNMGRVLAVAEGLGSLQDVVDAVRCMVTLELLVVLELLMLELLQC